MSVLKIEGVSKRFKRKKVLDNISMEVDNGIYGFLGPNGAGKTTFLRCLAGIYKIEQGDITYMDKYSVRRKEYAKSLGYLPQNFGLFKDMKVIDMMMYFASLKTDDEKAAKTDVLECLEKVNLLDKTNEKIKKLSGGMVRRLGIAQALVGNPKVIIFDEPTTGLDPEERLRFKMLINMLSKDKVIIISTHIASDIDAICNNVIVLNDGKILINGKNEELISKADNKVYEIEDVNAFKDDTMHLVTSYEKEGKTVYRVLSNEPVGKTVAPTLEDGYICLLKEL